MDPISNISDIFYLYILMNHNNPPDSKEIEMLNLSTRAKNAILRSGIYTFSDLVQEIELGKIHSWRGVGEKTYNEIISAVEKTLRNKSYFKSIPKRSPKIELIHKWEIINEKLVKFERQGLLNPDIKNLNLSNRTKSALLHAGIYTIYDLIKIYYQKKLCMKRGIGQKSLDEINIEINKFLIIISIENQSIDEYCSVSEVNSYVKGRRWEIETGNYKTK